MNVPKILNLDLLLKSYLFIPKVQFRNAMKKYGHDITGKTLDIGAGLKPFAQYFNTSEYISLDSDASLKPDVAGDILHLPFEDASFDSVVCLEVLEHVADTQGALREILRVLKPNGVFMVSTPMHWPLHYEPMDYWRFTRYGLEELLKKNYTVATVEKLGGLFSFLGARIAEESALFLYRLFPFLPRRARYALGHIANIPLSVGFYIFSLLTDWLFPQDAISWLVIAKKK
ncbi:MAG: class I SAM-dependent methyltransferase [Patescibacteria group bacterium]